MSMSVIPVMILVAVGATFFGALWILDEIV